MSAERFDDLIKLMPTIAKAVNSFTSEVVQQEAYRTLVDTYVSGASAAGKRGDDPPEEVQGAPKKRNATAAKAAKKAAKKATTKRTKVGTPKAVRGLDLAPTGKKSFKDFVTEKAPNGSTEQNAIATYYLSQILGQQVDTDHVFTCYREAGWKLMADLRNSLQVTASTKRWIDTADMDDIQLTPPGTNLVEHELPRKSKTKK